jgi:hypothetical protein
MCWRVSLWKGVQEERDTYMLGDSYIVGLMGGIISPAWSCCWSIWTSESVELDRRLGLGVLSRHAELAWRNVHGVTTPLVLT